MSQIFAQGEWGGENEIVWIIGGWGGEGGGQVCICVQCVQEARGVRGHVPPGNLILDLLLDAIWWNLGPFSYKHNLPFMCH